MEKDRRSSRIIMTNEARVLRDLRVASKLSMKRAGELLGKSDSYIAHIETGRMDAPKGPKLDLLLMIYGGLKQKSFYERVRKYQQTMTQKDELLSLIETASEKQAARILEITKLVLSDPS